MLMRGFTSVRDLGGPVVRAEARHRRRASCRGRGSGRRAPSSRRAAATATSGCRPSCRRGRATSATRARRGAAIADGADAVRQRVARAAAARRVADQADGRRRRGVELRSARRHAVQRGRAARRGRGGGELGHLRDRARLHAARGAPGDRGRREVHRPRPAARRGDREADGREGHLVEPAAVPGRRAVGLSGGLAEPDQAARDVRGHRHRLRAGEEVRGQDGAGAPTCCSTRRSRRPRARSSPR